MKHLFVINPQSFRTAESLAQIQRDLDTTLATVDGLHYEIYTSRHPRDAVAAVRRYLLGVDEDEIIRIYAVGGDGILFDCLNGMVKFPNAELGSVPYGSANDFVRAFGVDSKPAFRDILNLINAPTREVDIIHCGANYALIEVNVGIVGQTVIHANAILRSGKASWIRRVTSHIYTLSGVRALSNLEVIQQRYTVLLDGEDYSGNYANIHIANVACDGGSFVPSPYAIPDDGVLNVIFLASSSRLECLKIIKSRNDGTYEKSDLFMEKQCKTMEVYSDAPISIQTDGEAFYTNELKLEIKPKAVKFIVPLGVDFVDYSYRAYSKGKKGRY